MDKEIKELRKICDQIRDAQSDERELVVKRAALVTRLAHHGTSQLTLAEITGLSRARIQQILAVVHTD